MMINRSVGLRQLPIGHGPTYSPPTTEFFLRILYGMMLMIVASMRNQ